MAQAQGYSQPQDHAASTPRVRMLGRRKRLDLPSGNLIAGEHKTPRWARTPARETS